MKRIIIAVVFVLVSAVAEAQTQTVTFNLTWSDPNSGTKQEAGFNIERGPTATGVFKQIATTKPDVTTYTDTITNDPGSTQYCYRVTAYNSAGTATSNVVCGTSAPLVGSPSPPVLSITVVTVGTATSSSGAATKTKK
jgi:hypothetical protein